MTLFQPEQLTSLIAQHDYHGALEQLAATDLAGLSDAERGRALAIEAVCKDRLTQQGEFLSFYLAQVMEQIKAGWVFRSGLAEQLIALDEYAAAEELLRNLVVQLPADGRIRCDLAAAVEQQGRLEEAEALYSIAASRAPELGEAHLGRGRCLQALGRIGEAAAALRDYLALRDDDQNAWISLAVLEAEQERYEAADGAFALAAALGPDSPALLFHRAMTAARQGSERAGEYAERLAEVAPADWRAEAAAALVEELHGSMEAAHSAMLRAFDLALIEPDGYLQEAGLVQVFLFLQRHGLKMQADTLEAALLSHGILPEGVLSVVRAIRNNWSEEAADYFVLISGKAPLHAAVASGDFHRTGEQWRGFLRAYRVYANSAQSAATSALLTESRSGGRDHQVEDTELKAPAGGQYLGVRFRSGRMFYNEQES